MLFIQKQHKQFQPDEAGVEKNTCCSLVWHLLAHFKQTFSCNQLKPSASDAPNKYTIKPTKPVSGRRGTQRGIYSIILCSNTDFSVSLSRPQGEHLDSCGGGVDHMSGTSSGSSFKTSTNVHFDSMTKAFHVHGGRSKVKGQEEVYNVGEVSWCCLH